MSEQHLVGDGYETARAAATQPQPGANWARRIALLAAVALAAPDTAQAQSFWHWGPADYYELRPPKPKRPRIKRNDPDLAAAKKAPKPVGPLLIAVSVQKQRVKVYDSNGLFAEAPVSTGTKSHPTPYGVFSIIQKNRHHVSNLYGASMPYMQRITWSGVAMHTGPLPGYAASHGCIRLPNEFAARLWTWTKMGTRVIVAPGEVAPAAFSHPKLIARMGPVPTVSAAPEPARTMVGDASTDSERAGRAQQRTADARDAIAGMKGTLSDVGPAAPSGPGVAGGPAEPKRAGVDATSDAQVPLPGDSDQRSVDKPTDADQLAVKPQDRVNSDEAATTAGDTSSSAEAAPVAAMPADPAQEIARPADIVQPAEAAAPAATPESARPAVVASTRRHSHVAVFISRKDRKLYIRHGYEPIFDTPVEIADAERPLGTHVFTARGDNEDANALNWSVVSLPQVARRADPRRASRQGSRKSASASVRPNVIPPLSASDALDRVTIPAEALQKIAAIISPGGSILISDHGLSGWETGKGTDFIVPLR